MPNRVVTLLVFIPLGIILIALAVANRAVVGFTLDPFRPGNPALTLELPLFVHLLVALALGVIIGSITTWFRQGRYRRIARERTNELERLRESERERNAALVRTDI